MLSRLSRSRLICRAVEWNSKVLKMTSGHRWFPICRDSRVAMMGRGMSFHVRETQGKPWDRLTYFILKDFDVIKWKYLATENTADRDDTFLSIVTGLIHVGSLLVCWSAAVGVHVRRHWFWMKAEVISVRDRLCHGPWQMVIWFFWFGKKT